MLAALVARSRDNANRSRVLCAWSASLVAESQAIVRRRLFRIAGAADTDIPTCGARTLAKAQRGGLPAPFDGKLCVGRGSLQPCSGCGEKIVADDIEHEIEFPTAALPLSFRFHADCYKAGLTSGATP